MLNWFGGANGETKNTKEKGTHVTLNIYDLGPAFAGANVAMKAIGTGAFHAGVEVYGVEWSFSCAQDGPYRSGIFRIPPKGCTGHVYRESVEMGRCEMSAREVRHLVEKLYKEWPGSDYDLLRKNCCHFSDSFCQMLGVGPIPSWVCSLANTGAALRSVVRVGVAGVANLPGGIADVGANAPAYLWAGAVGVGGFLGNVGAAVGGALAPGPEDAGGKQLALPGDGGYPGAPPSQPNQPRQMNVPNLPGMGRQPQQGRQSTATASAAPLVDAKGGASPWVEGDAVEVWSNSHRSWCLGSVESVRGDGCVKVAFRTHNDAMAEKILPWGHDHLRRAVKTGGGAGGGDALKKAVLLGKGDTVEVFSNSSQAWCPGYVEGVNGQMLNVVFRLPNAPLDQKSHKQVPMDHKDVRRAVGAAEKAGLELKRAGGSKEPSGHTATASASAAPPSSKRGSAAEAAASDELKATLKRTKDPEALGEAIALAEAKGAPAAELEAARAVATKLACLEEVEAARRSKDANWIEQACKRALDAEVASDDLKPARADARKLYALDDVGNAVKLEDEEVLFEAVQLAEAAGVTAAEIEAVKSKAVAAMELARKTIPPPGAGAAVPLGSAVLAPSVGNVVEVYSKSHQKWCIGRITKVTSEGPKVQYQLPGARAEDWVEKIIPHGSNGLRRPEALVASLRAELDPSSPHARSSPSRDVQEDEAYAAKFRELAGPAPRIGTEIMAKFLRGSGLPRKVLKQVWLSANPYDTQDFGPAEFATALRLTGHCQAVLSSGDAGAAELLAEGGEALCDLMESEWKHRPAPVLPRFHGHLLEAPSPAKR